MRRAPLRFLLPVAVSALTACGSSSSNDLGGTIDGGTTIADGGTTADTGVTLDGGADADAGTTQDAAVTCTVSNPDPTPDPGCTGTWITTFRGELVSPTGAPIDRGKAQVCLRSPNDVLRCLRPGDTCAGHFEIQVAPEARCVERWALRALLPNAQYAATYCELPLTGAPNVELAAPFLLYPTETPASLPPLGSMSQVRSVRFADGLELDLAPDKFASPYVELAAHKLTPSDPLPCFLAGQPAFDGVWGFSPEGDIFSTAGLGAPVRIPNSTNLPANSTVRMFVLGGLDCTLDDDSLVTEAEWREYGNGTVSADGTVIEGARLPCLSWFGYIH